MSEKTFKTKNKEQEVINDIIRRQTSHEKELICKLLRNPQDIKRIRTIVSKEDFRYFGSQYENILDSVLNGKNIMLEFSQAGFLRTDFLDIDLMLSDPLRGVVEVANDVKKTMAAWNLLNVLYLGVEKLSTEDLPSFVATLQRDILSQVNITSDNSSDVENVIEDFRKQQEFYLEKFKSGNKLIGHTTGYHKLDEIIDGLRPEHLWVIGGYSNLGKTSASLNIARSLIGRQKRVVFYSLEMSKVDILSKLIGIMTNQSGLTVLKNFPHNKERVTNALNRISKSNMSIHNSKYDLDTIEFSMYDEHMKAPVDLFIIDFLQLITVKDSKSEYETMTNAILRLQQAAKRLKVPIIVLSQISNEGAKMKNEVVMSFKGSGSIASAADLAIEIEIGEDSKTDWKAKLYAGEPVKMKWNIRKNRHGKVGYIDMLFTGFTGRFLNADIEDFKDFKGQIKGDSLKHPDDYLFEDDCSVEQMSTGF